MTSLFPKSDTSSLKNQAAQSSLLAHTSITSCRNFSTFPKQTVPLLPPEFQRGSRGINTRVRHPEGSEFRDCARPTRRARVQNQILPRVELFGKWRDGMHHELKWKINPRKVETEQDLGPTPMPAFLECLWRGGGCVGYSQFPKPLASTTSRPPNPSVSNTGEREDGNTTGWKRLLVLCWPGWNIYMLESTEQQENRELRVQAPG